MTVFDAGIQVANYFNQSLPKGAKNQTAILAIDHKGRILEFKTVQQAFDLVNPGEGFVFECKIDEKGIIKVSPRT